MAYIDANDTKLIRQALKEQFPAFRFTVKKWHCSSVTVTIKSGPVRFDDSDYTSINHHHPEQYQHASLLKKIIHCVNNSASSPNFDYSDSMTYYFHVGYYVDIQQGTYDRPYEVKKPVKTGKKKAIKAAPLPAVSSGLSFTLQEHTHTKKGRQMWLAIPSHRVERDEYLALLDGAKALGGWYSQAWNGTPGGFAFKDEELAKTFIAAHSTTELPPVTAPQDDADKPKPASNGDVIADKLQGLGEGMQKQIEAKFADRLTNTPKRAREAASARLDGEEVQRAQQILFALADHHRKGTVPDALADVKTKKQALELARSAKDNSNMGYYDVPLCLNKPHGDNAASLAAWALLAPKTAEEIKADELASKISKLQFANIDGYFPTPESTVARMIELAGIEAGHKCLEPEAGSGAIADQLPAGSDCLEVNFSLREVLEMKGHNVIDHDFMRADISPIYDRVVMNPPFERQQDIDHVRKAYDCLMPGGRLVAIMSPG